MANIKYYPEDELVQKVQSGECGWLDFINHRPLEIDAIVGSVIRRARKYGVDTPIMDTVYTTLKEGNAQNLKVN